jgi:hypothetical protein
MPPAPTAKWRELIKKVYGADPPRLVLERDA